MVNAIIVSRYQGPPPPPVSGGNRKLKGPLYPEGDIKALLAEGGVKASTEKCINDMQKWEIDNEKLKTLICEALDYGDYKDSEWAELFKNGPWAACDAYVLHRDEWIPAAKKHLAIEYYLKFAVSKTGKLVITISCHPPENR